MKNEYNFFDKHFSKFLLGHEELHGERGEQFQNIVLRLTSSLEKGSSCIQLSASEQELLGQCQSVRMVQGIDEVPDLPLVLFGDKLYLQRYFFYEARLTRQLQAIAACKEDSFEVDEELLALTFGEEYEGGEENLQRYAAIKALEHPFLIVSGGPGTGKTTTVVRIIATLVHTARNRFRVALCAPTGKAAQRLYESVCGGIPMLPQVLQDEASAWLPESAMTLHRLLGYQRYSTRFICNRENPLPYDLVLVDEASMVDLALMSKLVDALKPGSRLLLLGDKDQLASVESGTVLSAVLKGLPACSVELKKTYRFEGAIKALAESVKSGDPALFLELVRPCLLHENWQQRIEENFLRYIHLAKKTECRDIRKLFEQLKKFMVLCCVKRGLYGVEGINSMVETALYGKGHDVVKNTWYPGRPVLVNRNDYDLGLYNGDIGICLADEQGTLRVWFEDGNSFKRFPTAALHNCETLYAMTVHKSQGSEFEEVLLIFPDADNQLLCRELLYTGITRARKKVSLVAGQEILRTAVSRLSRRGTGLTEMLRSS